MKAQHTEVIILLAEDDDDDYELICEAMRECHFPNELRRVKDGVELMDYLRRSGPFSDPKNAPLPGLILLDLNMPRKDGRECLREIKADTTLKAIPIVALTSSRAEQDVLRSYQLGLNSYIQKPVTFAGLVQAVQVLGNYWFQLVDLPVLAKCQEA